MARAWRYIPVLAIFVAAWMILLAVPGVRLNWRDVPDIALTVAVGVVIVLSCINVMSPHPRPGEQSDPRQASDRVSRQQGAHR